MAKLSDPKWNTVMPIELTAAQWLAVHMNLTLMLAAKHPQNDGEAGEMIRDVLFLIEVCFHTEGLLTTKEIEEIKQVEKRDEKAMPESKE